MTDIKTVQALVDGAPTLYERTGDIADVNTLLVNRAELRALLAQGLTEQDAYELGAKGGPASERERLLFEAWMRGHCWALCAEWTGTQYLGSSEQGGDVDPRAMATRRLWAAWRDRAALASPGTAPQLEALLEKAREFADCVTDGEWVGDIDRDDLIAELDAALGKEKQG